MSKAFLFDMETFFLALADKTRLRLLNLMRGGEVCVCFFVEVLEESQPKISRHLAYLRNAGVVSARRDGKWVHYALSTPENPRAARVLQDTLDWLASEEAMRDDYQKLVLACCAPDAPVTLAREPKPDVSVETHASFCRKEEIETFLL